MTRPVTAMLTTLLYCNFNSYCANTKLYLILFYRHADCLKSIYQIAANSKYAIKQTIHLYEVTVIYVTYFKRITT